MPWATTVEARPDAHGRALRRDGARNVPDSAAKDGHVIDAIFSEGRDARVVSLSTSCRDAALDWLPVEAV